MKENFHFEKIDSRGFYQQVFKGKTNPFFLLTERLRDLGVEETVEDIAHFNNIFKHNKHLVKEFRSG